MPITWQNINAPSLGDPNRSLQGATEGLANAFTPLREQLTSYQRNDQQNFEVDRKNRLDAAMANIMSRYTSPQAFEAAKKSGEVDQLLATLSPQDRLAGAQFADNRGSVLEARSLASMTFKDADTENRLCPVLQQATALAAANDRVGLDNLLAGNKEFADYYRGTVEQQAAEQSRAQGKYVMDLRTGQSNIDHQRATEATSAEQARAAIMSAGAQQRQAATAEGQLGLSRDEATRRWNEQDRQVQAAKIAATMQSALKTNIYRDGVYDGSQAEALSKEMADAGLFKDNPAARAEILNKFKKNEMEIEVPKKGGGTEKITVPIPLGAIRQAIFTGETNWIARWGDKGVGNRAADNLKEIMQQFYGRSVQDTGNDGHPFTREIQSSRVLDDYQAYQQILQNAAAAVGGPEKKSPGTTPQPLFPKPTEPVGRKPHRP